MGNGNQPEQMSNPLCGKCPALCCRYVAIEIQAPSAKEEFDHIRWYLLHRDVQVFIDHEGGWFVEFVTPCEELDADNRCSVYDRRPEICRSHGNPPEVCEMQGTPYVELFHTPEEFDDFLRKKNQSVPS